MDKMRDKIQAYFASLKTDAAVAVADVLGRWGIEHSYNRNGNATDHRTWKADVAGTDQAQSRVSLDKYVDGRPCIIVNRMLAVTWQEVIASAVHGAILAWRSETAAPDDRGRLRLIDKAFTDLASFAGLTKIAEKLPTSNGKGRNVSDTTRRAWYGASGALVRLASECEAEFGPLPVAFAGTDDKPQAIGTLMIPADLTLADGSSLRAYVRVSSYTKNPETAGNEFNTLRTNKSVKLDTRSRSYRTLIALLSPGEKVEDGKEQNETAKELVASLVAAVSPKQAASVEPPKKGHRRPQASV